MPTFFLLQMLAACAPADLADPLFSVDEVPERAYLQSLNSARVLADDPEPIAPAPGFVLSAEAAALDWTSDQVQVGWRSGGVLWTVWLDRADLVSAVPERTWVAVGAQGAGVTFPAGLRLEHGASEQGLWVSHSDGLDPIPVPEDTLDQVFPAELRLRYGQYSGSGYGMLLQEGAHLRTGPQGPAFAYFEGGMNDWVTPMAREGAGWWLSWDAHFGTVEAWVSDSELEEVGEAGGGWGGSGCGGIVGLSSHGFGGLGEPTLPEGTLLLDAPGGVAFGRLERPRWELLGEPVQDFYPVRLHTPWGAQELWAYLP